MDTISTIFSVLLLFMLQSDLDASNFKFTNVVCDSHNKSWIVFHECRLRVVQRNNVTFNLNATLLHPVTVLHINTQILKKANGYKPWLVNVTIDFCAYLRRRNNPTINLVFGFIRTVSNLYHHCPFQGAQLISNLYISPEMLRIPLPTGEYLLLTNWMFEKQIQAITKFYFTFVENLL